MGGITSVKSAMGLDGMEKITTINIKKKTYEKLVKIGQFGQSFDDVINTLLSKEGRID